MKKVGYFSILFLLIMSCSIKEKPIFIKVDNVKVISFATDTIRLKAEAFFKNLNDIGGKISTDEIKIIVNGAEVAQVFAEEFKVPARQEFAIPLTAVIPTKKVLENNENGILGGLLNTFLKKSVKVRFKGNLKHKVFGFTKTYAIDKVEVIKF